MVKITNIFGDEAVGKVGNTIYQKHYGRQIRRKGFKRGKKATPQQEAVRNNFKEAVSWAKNLTPQQKYSIKQMYNKKYPSWSKGQPSTWYNFAKTIYMQQPHIQLIDPINLVYKVSHIAIKDINLYDDIKRPIKSVESLSSFDNCNITSVYSFSIPTYTYAIGLTTLCDVEYIHFLTNDTQFYTCESFTDPCPNSK